MKILTHEMLIYVNKPKWGKFEACSVGTVEGYAATSTWQTAEEAVERAIKNNHELAYTISSPKFLSSDPSAYIREEERKSHAIEVEEGEIVLIEGRKYKIKLMGPQYSDPIHFIPVKGE